MFLDDLALGQKNQEVVFADFARRGLIITPTQGKHPFDGFLPDGRSIEVKLDLMSQSTGNAAIELPTLQRHADFYAHTLCYYRIYTNEDYWILYKQGKIPLKGMGDQQYDGRLIPTKLMRTSGMYPSEFIKYLNDTN